MNTRIAAFATALFAASPAFAVDGTVPVHGTLLDASGRAVDGVLPVTFSIYDNDQGAGAWLWSDTLDVDVDRGLFAALLGSSLSLPLEMFDEMPELFLEITVDGTDPLGPVPMTSAPNAGYAEYAGTASAIGGVSAADLIYSNGAGIDLSEDTFSLNAAAVEAIARGVCFDTEAEVLTAIADDFRAFDWQPTWGDVADIPDDIADGDDGFTLEAELEFHLDDNYLPIGHSPVWVVIDDLPLELTFGLAAVSPLSVGSDGTVQIDSACAVDQLLVFDGTDWVCAWPLDLALLADGPGTGFDFDSVDGVDSGDLAATSHGHPTSDVTSGVLSDVLYSAHADLVAEGLVDLSAAGDLVTVTQGDGRFLDVDEAYSAALLTSGTLDPAMYDAYQDLDDAGVLDIDDADAVFTQSRADGRFLNATENHSAGLITSGTLDVARYDARSDLNGAGLLDGSTGTDLFTLSVGDTLYRRDDVGYSAVYITSGTLSTSWYDAYAELTAASRLDGNASTDLITQAQGDARYHGPDDFTATTTAVSDANCTAVALTFCPIGVNDGPTCTQVQPGMFCEADGGECGTDQFLDNCVGGLLLDWYIRTQ